MKVDKRKYFYNVPNLLQKRRSLRNGATNTEKILWEKLKHSQLGVKFRRQFSIQGYILDFYCPSMKIAIELDGEIHVNKKDYDAYRDKYLSGFGITTLRFKNDEIKNNISVVLQKIVFSLKPPPA